MHIWVVCQYYKPEPGAPSARLAGLAEAWQSKGHKVTVLTAIPNHPTGVVPDAYRNRGKFFEEELDGVTVKRHWLKIAPNEGMKNRVMSHLTFALSLLVNLFRKNGERPDVVIASSPSFFSVASGWLLARRWRAKFVFEVRDPWPGIFVELGVLQQGFTLRALEWLEMFLYRRADAVVTVTESLAKDIISRGIPAEKVHVVTNGLSDRNFARALQARTDGSVDRLRTDLQLNPLSKIVLYLGTHGISQGLGQVLDAAKTLMTRSDILFLFVGDGADKARLKRIAQGMPNVQFMPAQPGDSVWSYYALANVCLVPLRDIAGFRKLIPSKLFETLGSGRPTLAAVAGEAAQLLRQNGVALVVPPEDSEKIAYGLLKMIDHPEQAERIGQKAQEWVKANYLHSTLGARYLNILTGLTDGKAAAPATPPATSAATPPTEADHAS